jgi:hypothetical protein
MANISQYMQLNMLSWVLGGSPTKPAAWGIGLSQGSPTSTSGSEISTTFGYTRSTMSWGAAGSPTSSGTVSNVSAVTFGPFTTACTISGIQVWDTASQGTPNVGSLLFEGLLGAARTLASGDSLVIPTGSLLITLA